jgi:predicted phage-related endonuclease
LVEGARNFWDLVVAGKEPPVDESEATSSALAQIFPGDGGEVDLDDKTVTYLDSPITVATAVAELRYLKAERQKTKKKIDGLENSLKALLGDAEIGLWKGAPLVTWKQQTRAEHVVAESTFRVLRLASERDGK